MGLDASISLWLFVQMDPSPLTYTSIITPPSRTTSNGLTPKKVLARNSRFSRKNADGPSKSRCNFSGSVGGRFKGHLDAPEGVYSILEPPRRGTSGKPANGGAGWQDVAFPVWA